MSSSELDTLQQLPLRRRQVVHVHHLGQEYVTLGRSDYQRQYEPILYGGARATTLLVGARDQGDVWLVNKLSERSDPTMKPVELVERALRNSSKPKTSCSIPSAFRLHAYAAERRRRCRMMNWTEVCRYHSPPLQEYTGREAKRQTDGLAFNALADPKETETA